MAAAAQSKWRKPAKVPENTGFDRSKAEKRVRLPTDGTIAIDTTLMTPAELQACMSDPWWRITSGALYKIIIKEKDDPDDESDEGLVIPFVPNRAQRRFLKRMWNRNIILKARQLGFTTLIAIVWLDHALFNANSRCGIIAQDRDAAKIIFRDKVKFAYKNLPEALRAVMPLSEDNADEMVFKHNNSSIRVATSMRSGTLHRLHVSEFGKICAKFPDKAQEVITGSIPAVPKGGITIIESTAEGREGEFHDMTQRALGQQRGKKELTVRDYRMHFFPWFEAPEYEMDPATVVMTAKDHDYFDAIEAAEDVVITLPKRAWYVATRDADFSGKEEKMWQEYPSTPDEAFQRSTEGCYYTKQIADARKGNRILEHIPLLPGVPCNTFWDIGSSDGCAIWVHQQVGMENRFLRFYEAWHEPYSHAVQWLQSLGVIFRRHYLPHDADHIRQGGTANKSPKQMLEELLPGATFEVVPRIQDVNWGIQSTRDKFPTYYFDETHCKAGIIHVESYKKKWNLRLGCWDSEPSKEGGHSEAADALRQHAQGYSQSLAATKPKASRGSWRTR